AHFRAAVALARNGRARAKPDRPTAVWRPRVAVHWILRCADRTRHRSRYGRDGRLLPRPLGRRRGLARHHVEQRPAALSAPDHRRALPARAAAVRRPARWSWLARDRELRARADDLAAGARIRSRGTHRRLHTGTPDGPAHRPEHPSADD